jgi:hypothetical protein
MALVRENRASPPQACLGAPVSSIELTISPINYVTALPASVQAGFYWPVGKNLAEIEGKPGAEQISG